MKIGEIEKDMPIIPRNPSFIYPFRKMEVNDSFLVKIEKGESFKQIRSRLGSVVLNMKRTHGLKFATRTVEEGIRIWRIE